MVYVKGGRFLEAEAGQWTHSRRWEMETARYRCHLWLADAYAQQGTLSLAQEQMECLLRLDPTDEAALARILQLLHQQGMTALARRRYREHKRFLEPQGITLSSTLEALMQPGQGGDMPDCDEGSDGEGGEDDRRMGGRPHSSLPHSEFNPRN